MLLPQALPLLALGLQQAGRRRHVFAAGRDPALVLVAQALFEFALFIEQFQVLAEAADAGATPACASSISAYWAPPGRSWRP